MRPGDGGAGSMAEAQRAAERLGVGTATTDRGDCAGIPGGGLPFKVRRATADEAVREDERRYRCL